jgi:phi13 family phage major tail protein
MPINANPDEYKSVIGLDSIYVAEVMADSSTAYTAGTPETLAPAAEISMKPVSSQETQYADNQPYDIFSSEAETDMEITLTGVPSEMLAKILGSVFNAASGRVYDSASTPPWMALGFRSMKSNGKYRYYWFQKVQFSPPEEGAATKADKANPKTIKLACKAIKTVYKWDQGTKTDSVKRIFGDEDTTNFSATAWFSQVQVPGTTPPAALQLSSSSPIDGATGVAVSVSPTLTFNNALVNEAVNMVSLSKTSDGTLISMASGYPQLDATKKIMTLDPASNLTASTAYKIAYNVKDIYGQWLQGIVDFTTA